MHLAGLARALLPGLVMAMAACSLILPAPEVDCSYLEADECERAVDVALDLIVPERGLPRVIQIGDPCRGVPCPASLYEHLREIVIIVNMSFETGMPIEVAVDRRDWTARRLDPVIP
jgi:hypothetical protein